MNRILRIGHSTVKEFPTCRHDYYVPMCPICSEEHRKFEQDVYRFINDCRESEDTEK